MSEVAISGGDGAVVKTYLARPPVTPLLKVAGVGYHHPSAEDAWRRILRFFAEHLQAPADAA